MVLTAIKDIQTYILLKLIAKLYPIMQDKIRFSDTPLLPYFHTPTCYQCINVQYTWRVGQLSLFHLFHAHTWILLQSRVSSISWTVQVRWAELRDDGVRKDIIGTLGRHRHFGDVSCNMLSAYKAGSQGDKTCYWPRLHWLLRGHAKIVIIA